MYQFLEELNPIVTFGDEEKIIEFDSYEFFDDSSKVKKIFMTGLQVTT